VNQISGLDRVARGFFRAKRQSCLRIDVSSVVVIYGVKSDVDDTRGFHVRSQLNGLTTKMNASREDFNFHVRSAGKV
jgi:hypothetical protein